MENDIDPRDSIPYESSGNPPANRFLRYILREMPGYPDYVFIFTDGFMPKPKLRHPERWIWLLTPNGTDLHVPKPGKICRFDPRET